MTNPLPSPRPHPARPPLPAGLPAGVLAGAASIQAVGVLWAQDLAFTLSAVAGFAALAALAAVGSARHHPHPRFGAANQITLARGTATALLAGLVAAPDVLRVSVVHAWLPFAAASALLILDLCDGALARRQGLASNFGARFDREVDAAAILVLSALAVVLAGAPVWTLGIGALRYLYLGAGWLVPALTRPLPYSLRRRAVCGVQIAALGILLAPPLPEAWIAAIAGAALAALALSFLRDLLWCLARPLGVTPRPARGVRA